MSAERSVLCAMMVDNGTILAVMPVLSPEDFFRPAHQRVCAAIYRLAEREVVVDLVTLSDELSRNHDLEKVGGDVALADILDETTTAAGVEHHAAIIQEKSKLRRLIGISRAIAEGVEGKKSPGDLMDATENAILSLGSDHERSRYRTLYEAMPDVIGALEARVADKRDVTGVPTGFYELDRMTLGIQRKELSIVAARPSVGKTAFSLCIAMTCGARGHKSLLVSLEMAEQSLIDRMLAMEARMDGQRIRSGFLNEEDLVKLAGASGNIAQLPIRLDCGTGQSVFEIRSKARRMMMEDPFDLIIVDYLQLIESPGVTESRAAEIGVICRALKGMADSMNVAVLATAQLKRPGSGQEKKRPFLSDLKDSGSIEQDADLVVFLHRPEIYQPDDASLRGLAEVIVAKQRNGPIGYTNLQFVKEQMRFDNLSAAPEAEEA